MSAILQVSSLRPCRWNERAEVGPSCREGLCGPAATASEPGLPLSELLASAPSRLFTLRRKSFPAERTYMKSPKRSLLELLFPYANRRRSTIGLLEQVP